MSFKSKRLRVQIPCVDESLVEIPARTLGTICRNIHTLQACQYPSCPNHSLPITDTCVHYQTGCLMPTQRCPEFSVCRFGTRDTCGPVSPYVDITITDTPVIREQAIEAEQDPENPRSVLIGPKDLPLVRSQLEQVLADSEQRLDEAKDQLKEIDSIEGALEKRLAEEE